MPFAPACVYPHRGPRGGGLFNIADDPSEKKNLIADHPEIAASLEKEFAEWNKKLIDPKWVTLHKSKSGP